VEQNHQEELVLLGHYNFDLPKSQIAQYPMANRCDSRMMVVNRSTEEIEHFHTRDLPDFLTAGDTLVLNDTRVIPAKLVGRRSTTGGKWQGLYLKSDENGIWKLLCKTRTKIKPGDKVRVLDRQGAEKFELTMLTQLDEGAWAAKPETDGSPLDLLRSVGQVPLPHYIRGGNMVDADVQTYQTIFAKRDGAIAAPTAGLHLTKPLLSKIKEQGVNIASVTLHVGIGTFRPIKSTRLDQHQMHREWGEISADTAELLNQTRASGNRIIAVGTTCVRVLESCANEQGHFSAWDGETDLFIYPPYKFKAIDGLMTNFHLPQSTLLVLVRTFGGDSLIQKAYEEAVKDNYRFFSYGDAMLIL
jgi:S-adenosylmethionine:tRNA ribosyltransferase-isomerase